MPTQHDSRALVNIRFCALRDKRLPVDIDARIQRNLANRMEIGAFRAQQVLGEGTQKQKIKIVLLKGADEQNVKKAVEKLRKDKPDIEFELVHEPEGDLELSNNTSAVVFVANGSNEGVDRHIQQSGDLFYSERIATVLVSEHKDDTDRFDHKMTFEHAIMNDMLFSALRAAHYYKRGEALN